MRCCIGDGGAGLRGRWSSAVALRGEAANHPELLRSRAVVVSVRGVRRAVSASGVGQEGERERTTEDVSKTAIDGIETGRPAQPGIEPGGCLLIGQVVSGMEVARAWSGLRCGTWEPVVPRPGAASGAVVARGRCWTGEPQAADPRGVVYRCGAQGADLTVVAMKAL
jgi:hypothetical protein